MRARDWENRQFFDPERLNVNERLARASIQNLLTFFYRASRTRYDERIFITKQNGSKIFENEWSGPGRVFLDQGKAVVWAKRRMKTGWATESHYESGFDEGQSIDLFIVLFSLRLNIHASLFVFFLLQKSLLYTIFAIDASREANGTPVKGDGCGNQHPPCPPIGGSFLRYRFQQTKKSFSP